MTRLVVGLLALVALVLFGAGCAVLFRARAETAHRWVNEGALLIDVRSAGEYAGGHLDGARNIPVGELANRVSELGARETKIVVYCHSGVRATRAAGILKDQGFLFVTNMGPMAAW